LQALAWGEYLETHAQRAYGSVSQPEIAVAKALLQRIKKGDLKSGFSSRDVWRPGWAKLSDRDQVKEALQLLEDYNWIYREKIEATGGRPRTVYHVNERAKI
jgi:2C-methyl-D-erythritol 2,4-cyclodiphosphate synthase